MAVVVEVGGGLAMLFGLFTRPVGLVLAIWCVTTVAFIVSFDLFAISLLLKGIGLETLPIQLFDYVTWDFDPTAAAVSTVSIAITMLAVLLIDRIVGLRSLRF